MSGMYEKMRPVSYKKKVRGGGLRRSTAQKRGEVSSVIGSAEERELPPERDMDHGCMGLHCRKLHLSISRVF